MATKYKAVNAACVTTAAGTLLYTVPAGRIAKLTYISKSNSNNGAELGIKKSGSDTMISGPSVSSLFIASWGESTANANAVKCMDLGIYFSEGDEVYAISSSGQGVFASFIEEYEED